MMRWLWLGLLCVACGGVPGTDSQRDGGVIITDSAFTHLEGLPREEMAARLDSVVILSTPGLPAQAGDTLTLEAEVFWRAGREPDAFMLVWNLGSCAAGEVERCAKESEYVSVHVTTGHVRALKDLPPGMQYTVTVGIAVATWRIDPIVS